MTSYERRINKKRGFTLIEVLVGLFCLSFCLLIATQLAYVLLQFPKEAYRNEDLIAVRQLQKMLAESSSYALDQNRIQFVYRGEVYELLLKQQRLVKQPGYEIFLKDIIEGEFYMEDTCAYVEWWRKTKNSAILYCE